MESKTYTITSTLEDVNTEGTLLFALKNAKSGDSIVFDPSMDGKTINISTQLVLNAGITFIGMDNVTIRLDTYSHNYMYAATFNSNGATILRANKNYYIVMYEGGLYNQIGGNNSLTETGPSIIIQEGAVGNFSNTNIYEVIYNQDSSAHFTGATGSVRNSNAAIISVVGEKSTVILENVRITEKLKLNNALNVRGSGLIFESKEAITVGNIAVLEKLSNCTFTAADAYVSLGGFMTVNGTLRVWEGISDYRVVNGWTIERGVTLNLSSDITLKALVGFLVLGTLNTNGATISRLASNHIEVASGAAYNQTGGNNSLTETGVKIFVSLNAVANFYNTNVYELTYNYPSTDAYGNEIGGNGVISNSYVTNLSVLGVSSLTITNSTVKNTLNLSNQVNIRATGLTLESQEAIRLSNVKVLENMSGCTFKAVDAYIGLAGLMTVDGSMRVWEGISDYRIVNGFTVNKGATLNLSSDITFTFAISTAVYGTFNTNDAKLVYSGYLSMEVGGGGIYNQIGGGKEAPVNAGMTITVQPGAIANFHNTYVYYLHYHYSSAGSFASGSVTDSNVGTLVTQEFTNVDVSNSQIANLTANGTVNFNKVNLTGTVSIGAKSSGEITELSGNAKITIAAGTNLKISNSDLSGFQFLLSGFKTGNTIDLSGNYWGTTDIAAIKSGFGANANYVVINSVLPVSPTAPPAIKYPDLSISGYSVTDLNGNATFDANSDVMIKITVKNDSDTAANATKLKIYNNDFSFFVNVKALAAGESVTVSQNIGKLAAGNKTVKLEVDPDKTIAESNENNNTKDVTFTVNSVKYPDLTIRNSCRDLIC